MTDPVERVRRFNRFFTRFVGALDPSFLGSGLTLSEARMLFEIAARDSVVAAELGAALGVDRAYVSRTLRRFEAHGWVRRDSSAADRRRRPIALTEAGRDVQADLDARQRRRVQDLLDRLGPAQESALLGALGLAETLLDPSPTRAFSIRSFRPGDMGLIASRQAVLYREVYGWGPEIEVMEGEVTTNFLRNFKPGREDCWIAEVGGALAGSVFLTDEGEGACRLRLLYVEPFARGLGIGTALVEICVGRAREIGYEHMTLWTHTVLESARRIYAATGFEIIETHVHESLGPPVQSETWRLDLRAARQA